MTDNNESAGNAEHPHHADLDTIRRAAALMRERANCASHPTWEFLLAEEFEGNLYGYVRAGEGGARYTVAEADYANDAEHIASWHPAVALAAADLLEAVTCVCPPCSCCGVSPSCDGCEPIVAARAVARAYLGEEADRG